MKPSLARHPIGVMSEIDQSLRFSRASLPRVIAAGLVGASLPIVGFGAVFAAEITGLMHWICPTGGLECLAPIALIAVVGGSAAAWPLLLLVRVRPAWAVALLGFVFNLVLQSLVGQVIPGGLTRPLLFVDSAISLAIAALIIRPRSRQPVGTLQEG